MNNEVKMIFAFVLGAAAGSAVTWKLIKTKYEQIAQEEIDSVKAVYSKKKDELRSTPELPDEAKDPQYTEEETEEYENLAEAYGSDEEEEGGCESMPNDEPYVISPEEFGEKDGYETVTLTYYADDILTDDADQPIHDVEDTVGSDALTRFGEYEDDTVYVRNDARKCDYEICADDANYYDA